MNNRAARYLVVLTAAVVTSALAAAVPVAAVSTNVCTVAGSTTAVAIKILGAGATASYAHPSGGGSTCKLSPKDALHHASIEVAFVPASKLSDLIEADEYQGTGESRAVSRLGSGAVLLVFTSGYTGAHVWFRAGSHAIELTSEAPKDDPKLLNATVTASITVARAVYAHLR